MKNYKQSFDALPILQEECSVTTSASIGEVIVGLAEYVDRFTLASFIVESVVTFNAHV